MPMPTVHDVAAYILAKRGEMGTMKLQKLVYYSQAWSLAWDGRPLFDEPIQRWDWGPVVPALYSSHRKMPSIDRLDRGNPEALGPGDAATIDAVLRVYGDRSEWWLSNLTHAERPWREAARNQVIGHGELAEYYGQHRTEAREFPPEVLRGFQVLAMMPHEAVDGFLQDGSAPIEGLEDWLESGQGDPWQAASPG
jgi:uncharacterized phage-associated protein